MTDPVPAFAEVDRRYDDGSYAERYPDWHAEDAPWKADQVAGLLADHGLSGLRVCDIGCGTGAVLAELGRRQAIAAGVGYEPAVGVDFVDDPPPGVEYRRAPAGTDGDRFDLALMLDVFEHVPDYLGFLEAARPLAPRFVFHIPLDANVYNLLRPERLTRLRRESGHLHYFDRVTALDVLSDTGYDVVEWRHTPAYDAPVVASSGRGAAAMATVRRAGARISPSATASLLGGLPLLVLATTR